MKIEAFWLVLTQSVARVLVKTTFQQHAQVDLNLLVQHAQEFKELPN
jgi:hypothetical protein